MTGPRLQYIKIAQYERQAPHRSRGVQWTGQSSHKVCVTKLGEIDVLAREVLNGKSGARKQTSVKAASSG